jgi:hypothetical protein
MVICSSWQSITLTFFTWPPRSLVPFICKPFIRAPPYNPAPAHHLRRHSFRCRWKYLTTRKIAIGYAHVCCRFSQHKTFMIFTRFNGDAIIAGIECTIENITVG